METKKVCIFCGARTGNSPEIIEKTKEIVAILASKNIDLVYGGGNSGLMGIIADEFLKHNREVIGVRPDILLAEEISHQGITEMISTKDMFERKKKMVELSDFFIALPGGVGTLDEIIEVFTLNKIKSVNKKCGIYNIDNFYKGLEDLLTNMVDIGYLNDKDKKELYIEDNPEDLLIALLN